MNSGEVDPLIALLVGLALFGGPALTILLAVIRDTPQPPTEEPKP